ncbi:hypothetical protein M1N16_08705, partial [Nitrospinaceae bacterium]|nr:hypothetical protein [Nitrospinaceae bacterium]
GPPGHECDQNADGTPVMHGGPPPQDACATIQDINERLKCQRIAPKISKAEAEKGAEAARQEFATKAAETTVDVSGCRDSACIQAAEAGFTGEGAVARAEAAANAAALADGFCITEDACEATVLAAGLNLGGGGYPFVLDNDTMGCWYYHRDHENQNVAGNAYFGAAGTEAEMKDPNPGQYYKIRMKCGPAAEAEPDEAALLAEAKDPNCRAQRESKCRIEAHDACVFRAKQENVNPWGSSGRGKEEETCADVGGTTADENHDLIMRGLENGINSHMYQTVEHRRYRQKYTTCMAFCE